PSPGGAPHVQAKYKGACDGAPCARAPGLPVAPGGGAPLASADLARYSAAFGHDFSSVRIHPEHPAAAQLDARAFTVGQQIAFAPGEYRPGTTAGDRLVAHELAHVVQQSGGGSIARGAAAPGDAPSLSGDGYERQADRAAEAVVAGGRVGGISPL